MATNKESTRKLSRSFLLVFYWGKLLGINTFKLTKSYQLERSCPSIVYVIVLLTIYVYTVYRVVYERMKLMLPGETPLSVIIDYFDLTLEILEVLLGWSNVLINQNRIISIVNNFHDINETFKQLKIEEKYEMHYFRLAISLIIFNGFCVVRNTNLSMAHFGDVDYFTWVSYGIFTILPLNTGLLFVWIVVVVRENFRLLNEKIKKCTNDTRDRQLNNLVDEASLEIEDSLSCCLLRRIATVSRLHRELRNVLRLINELFALFILLNSLEQLLSFTTCVHITYRYLKDLEQLTWEDFLYTSPTSLWWISSLVMMSIISSVCGSTTQELGDFLFKANDTANILHTILNNYQIYDNNDKKPELHVLLLDLLHNKVKISFLGIVEANYFLVYSVIATAASYLTIMLQFYD